MNDFTDIRSILVIKLRNIGDVLLTVPAIRALKESFPRARICALVNSGTEDMLSLNPLVEEVIVLPRDAKKGTGKGARLAGEIKFVRGLRKKGFDMTVDLTGGDRAAIAGFSTGARYRLGYDPAGKGFKGKKYLYTHLAPVAEAGTHTVLRDLGLLRHFGIGTKDLTVDIYNSREDEEYVDRLLREKVFLKGERPFVHLHPVSRWLFKCWTDKGVAEIIKRFMETGLSVVVTSGPEERELNKVRSILGLLPIKPADLSGLLTLKQLAALSRRAALFFGVDSAPMHIAAAVGVPVVALFGPSGAFDWGPWDNSAIKGCLLKAPGAGRTGTIDDEKNLSPCSPYPMRSGIQRFGKNTVIQLDWDCIPCGKDGCGGTKKSDCLSALEPADVWEILKGSVEEVLSGRDGLP